MANPTKKAPSSTPTKKPEEVRFETLLAQYSTLLGVQATVPFLIGNILFFFGALGAIWMIPFPEIGFLKNLNLHLFVNWASFVIAFGIYYYLRLAPTLSYGVLFQLGIFSFLIVQLEYLEAAEGPQVWIVCTVIALIGYGIMEWAKMKANKKPMPLSSWFELIGHGPLWIWHFVFKRFKIPF